MDTNDFYSISRTTSNVYLFFSGNGLANNKEFYLDCANTIAKDVQNMAYPMSVVKIFFYWKNDDGVSPGWHSCYPEFLSPGIVGYGGYGDWDTSIPGNLYRLIL